MHDELYITHILPQQERATLAELNSEEKYADTMGDLADVIGDDVSTDLTIDFLVREYV